MPLIGVQIPTWAGWMLVISGVALMALGLVMICCAFRRRPVTLEKLPAGRKSLQIIAKVNQIQTLTLADQMGDKRITLDVTFVSSEPMRLAILSLWLEQWGQEVGADRLPPQKIKRRVEHHSIFFRVPKHLAIGKQAAQIHALADGHRWSSEPFEVDFALESRYS